MMVNDPKKEKQPEQLKTRKFRLHFNDEQSTTLRGWFGTCRFLYNKALFMLDHEEQEDEENKAKKLSKTSWRTLRNLLVPDKVLEKKR